MAKLEEREELGFTLGKILAKLNENFFSERGIKFRTGRHGTWIEMHIKDDAWAKESMGTVGAQDLQDMETDSMNGENNLQQYSVPNDRMMTKDHGSGGFGVEDKPSVDI